MNDTTKKLQFIDLYEDLLDDIAKDDLCMDDEEWQKYMDGEWDPYIVFEWDPDYMVTPEWDTIYFIIIGSRVYYIDSTGSREYIEELEEFCKWQDPTISRSWYNTRSSTQNWEYMEYEDNAWESFAKNKNLKIAYRWWCWYVYTLFEYIENEK